MINPIKPSLLKEIQNILSPKFETETKIKSTVTLSEESRRNLVLRIYLENSTDDIPNTVIFKQSLVDSASIDQDVLARFARDWSGLEFISSFDSENAIAPKFYGGSVGSMFILIEDLGADHLSLVDPLMSNDLQAAKSALNRYMKVMARFHGLGYQNIKNYNRMLKKIHPSADSWHDVDDIAAKVKSLLGKLNIEFNSNLAAEMNYVFKLIKEPGPFTALTHGDICPDNLVDDPYNNKMKIIDFEWSYVGNAFLDAVYLRMYMPTCWCAMAFPGAVIEEMDEVYRKELGKFIPLAVDDKIYYEHYIGACAYTIFRGLLDIETALEKERDGEEWVGFAHPKWKAEYNVSRQRMFLRLEEFIALAKKHDKFPYIRLMAETVLKELTLCWLDVKPLDLYPAFR